MGGVVAFEMARQLSAQGAEVPLLVLFDTVLAQDDARSQSDGEMNLLANFGLDIGLSLNHLAEGWQQVRLAGIDERLDYLLGQAQQSGLAPSSMTLADMTALFETFSHNAALLGQYRPAGEVERILYFKAGEAVPGAERAPADAWGALARA